MILRKCDICIDKECGCTNSTLCDCSKCINKDRCFKVLHPTIRITTKCTQRCNHCCFSCSPKETKELNLVLAKQINQFMNSNGCLSANIMGGEFWLHSDWQNIIDSLSNNLKTVRLVTNGDFAEQKENYQPVIDFLNTHENIYLSISYDQYHTNKNYDNAIKICNEYNLPYTIPSDKIKNSTDWVLPVGNLDITDNIYSLFGCYCQNPEHRYSFLIDEDGNIFKCTFGIWKYANVKDYIEGGFRSKFKEFNKKFYNVFISNCKSCSTQYFFSRKD